MLATIRSNTCLYLHTRKDDGSVFYVGIGKKRRPYESRPYNPHWSRVAEKHGVNVRIVYNNLTWQEACNLEIKLIKYYRDLNGSNLTNIADGGEGAKWVKRSPELIAKVANFNRGKHLSEEHKQKIREWNKGKIVRPETLLKMSASLKGIRHTEEAKRKISEALKGKPKSKEHIEALCNKVVTEETRAKMSVVSKRRILSPETRAKISKSLMGKKRSEESKVKQSASNKGRRHSEESKRKMSEAKLAKTEVSSRIPLDVGFCFRPLG